MHLYHKAEFCQHRSIGIKWTLKKNKNLLKKKM